VALPRHRLLLRDGDAAKLSGPGGGFGSRRVLFPEHDQGAGESRRRTLQRIGGDQDRLGCGDDGQMEAGTSRFAMLEQSVCCTTKGLETEPPNAKRRNRTIGVETLI
jgi:hypothetical protein